VFRLAKNSEYILRWIREADCLPIRYQVAFSGINIKRYLAVATDLASASYKDCLFERKLV